MLVYLHFYKKHCINVSYTLLQTLDINVHVCCYVTIFYLDPEALKFRDVEKRFLRQFKMPREEKLVNCTLCSYYNINNVVGYSHVQ